MDSYNTVLYNASTGVFVRELVQRGLILISLVPLIYGIIGFNTFILFYISTFCIIGFLMIGFIAWRGELKLNLSFRSMGKTMVRAMAWISAFGFFTGLTNEVVLQVNNILVNEFYDEAQTGIYVTNFFFATLILIPSRGLNKIAPTMISDAFKSRNLADIDRIQFKSTLNQLLIALLIFIGLYINLANIYQILPPAYAIGGWVIMLTGLANVVQMGGGVGSAILAFSGYYRFNTYLSIVQLVLLIGLNLLLLPYLGITGAAMATLISAILINLIKYLIIKKKFNIQPYSKKHLLIFLIAMLCVGINELIPIQSNYLVDIVIRSLVVALAYIVANYFLKTSTQLNDNLNKALRMLRIR
jgi:O-antigen/teichoic acid export membrane protein